jgi:hypothetical protein
MTPANDNAPVRHLVGVGNTQWRVGEQFGELTAGEIATVAKPLEMLNELVVQSMHAIRSSGLEASNGAVYVIGDVYGDECKIGKALDPIARLAQLQTGNHRQLFLHRVFWVDSKFISTVERGAHRIAGHYFDRLWGEWFSCGPFEAHAAIEAAITTNQRIKNYCVMTPLEPIMEVAA